MQSSERDTPMQETTAVSSPSRKMDKSAELAKHADRGILYVQQAMLQAHITLLIQTHQHNAPHTSVLFWGKSFLCVKKTKKKALDRITGIRRKAVFSAAIMNNSEIHFCNNFTVAWGNCLDFDSHFVRYQAIPPPRRDAPVDCQLFRRMFSAVSVGGRCQGGKLATYTL